jgi:type III pantothenate kinase
MKILAIDAGNSRVKWGLCDGEGWVTQGWVPTSEAARLEGVCGRLPRPDTVLAANVAGASVGAVLDAVARQLGRPLDVVRSRGEQCGVRSSYDDPEQLGPDRWAALIGAWHLFRGPAVVVNAGTTLTADALSREGVFLGGVIVPGATLMRDSLAHSTAGLRALAGRYVFFPASTADAITSGTVNALAGTIERMHRFLTQADGADALVVLSGGAATPIEPALNVRVEVVDNLVLEGILRIAHDASARSNAPGHPG